MSKILHTGNIIIVGFIAAALAMLFLVYKSTQVHFDLAAEGDYYKMEVGLNEIHQAQHSANALGDDFRISEKTDAVLISLPPRISSQITEGQVEFYCYSDSKMDKTAALSTNRDGLYRFGKDEYMPGKNYRVKVTFKAGGTDYYKEVHIN